MIGKIALGLIVLLGGLAANIYFDDSHLHPAAYEASHQAANNEVFKPAHIPVFKPAHVVEFQTNHELVYRSLTKGYPYISGVPNHLHHPWVLTDGSYDDWARKEVDGVLPRGFLSLPEAEQLSIYTKLFHQKKLLRQLSELANHKNNKKWYDMEVAKYKEKAKYKYGTAQYKQDEHLISKYEIDVAINPLGDMFGQSLLRDAVKGYTSRFEHDWQVSHGE